MFQYLGQILKSSLVGFELSAQVNTTEVMSSRSVYLTVLFLDRLCPHHENTPM